MSFSRLLRESASFGPKPQAKKKKKSLKPLPVRAFCLNGVAVGLYSGMAYWRILETQAAVNESQAKPQGSSTQQLSSLVRNAIGILEPETSNIGHLDPGGKSVRAEWSLSSTT